MHLTELELNDFADGVMDAPHAEAAARHIATCADCAREVERIVALKTQLAELPAEIAPARDLRSGMWQKIDDAGITDIAHAHTRIRAYAPKLRLAAAAVLLIAASSAITLAIVKHNGVNYPAKAANGSRSLVAYNERALEREYAGELEQLQAIVQKSRGTLAPETVRILEDNLKIIDNAIGEARNALAADPNSDMLVDLLRSAYERKLELLRQVAKSSSST